MTFGLFAQQELWMSTTDENIVKQASNQPQPLFQIPLGANHVSQMVPLNEKDLFIGLQRDNINMDPFKFLTIDTQLGKVLWEYVCGKGEYSLFSATESVVILQVKTKKDIQLLALSISSGREIWKTVYKGTDVNYLPYTDNGVVLVQSKGKKEMVLHALDITSGEEIWSFRLPVTTDTDAFVKTNEGKVFVFAAGIHVLHLESGQKLYGINEISINSLDPIIPVFDGELLYLMDDTNQIHCLNTADGKKVWNTALPQNLDVTNISFTPSKVMVNGQVDANTFQIAAIWKNNPQEYWTFESEHAITSNFLVGEEQLFFGNASKLYAVNPSTGEINFLKQVAKSGRSFPIALRLKNGNVVHIGELVVAAFKANTGSLVYKRGFSPVSVNLHFNGLDAALPQLQQQLSLQGQNTNSGFTAMASRESAYYQKMANESYDNYLKLRQSARPGSGYKANMERNRSRINSSMSRAFSGIAMSSSIIELGNAFASYIAQRTTLSEIKRQQYYRSSILSVYNTALSEEYVYRPNLQYRSREHAFVAVDIVALADGSVRRKYVSPQYLDFGLWNFIDFDKGILYHHGVGMDPDKYSLHITKRTPMVKSKTVGTFLIAQPMSR